MGRLVTLGILEAEFLGDKVQRSYGSYADMFQEMFQRITTDISFQVYQVTRFEYPDTFDDCDAFLLTGSKASAYGIEPWIEQLQEIIRQLYEQKIPLIGICFGHQLIAQALGGLVSQSEKGWGFGAGQMLINQHKSWMKPLQQNITLLMSHQDQVNRLPIDAELIAGNEFCPIAAYQIKNHILAFQGHPEFNRDYIRYIGETNCSSMGEDVYQKGIKTLEKDLDDKLISQWLLNFILAERTEKS